MTGGPTTSPAGPSLQVGKASRWRRVLKFLLLASLILTLGIGVFLGTVAFRYQRIVGASPGGLSTQVQPLELGRWVNPFLGSGGIPWVCGNNFPGAMLPMGAVRLGPETCSILNRTRALNTSGYYYGDNRLIGFSHTRLNGTGAVDGGHFLIVPAVKPVHRKQLREVSGTCFSHRDEIASPGYYAVKLPDTGTLVELTATRRVGVHRYTFAGKTKAHLYLNVSNALGGRPSTDAKILVRPDRRELEGHVRTFGTFASRYGGLKVYFAARFNKPFAAFSTWQGETVTSNQAVAQGNQVGADLTFAPTADPQVIVLKLAISHVSIESARVNLESEAGDDFDAVVAAAQKAWEDRLSRIRIQGGTEKQKRIFYTALYRAFQMPTLFNDANGEYLGFDQKIHRATEAQYYYTDLSLWDTFRTVHPLYTLIAAEEQRDILVSLTKMLEQGGWLPRWPSGAGYSNSMLGTPADILIAEAYLKGIRGFDVDSVYQAMRRTALAPVPPGSAFSGREGVEHYLKHGYCPAGLMPESVSRTLEFSWADSAIAKLAEALGHTDDAALFKQHQLFYRNLWNPQTKFFQPRYADGRFFEPFKPLLLTYLDPKGKFTRDYVEGSALQWRWGVPFDAEGLVALFGTREHFVYELEQFFSKSNPARGRWNPGPYYWHGNQPDIHAAYLFNAAGRPDLTQKWVRWVLENKYDDGYDGLDGNDDAGTLSAWYVFSALGFYPVAGSERYEMGAPLFEKAEVKIGTNTLSVIAENYAPTHLYVERAWLNDRLLDQTCFRHGEIARGGSLRFRMRRGE